ncbi:hypothetical protein ACOMHN_036984 [Nucella lapillus]
MQTSRCPHPTPSSPPPSSSPTSPIGRSVDGYNHVYTPAFSQDLPVFTRTYPQGNPKSRRNSTGPLIGASGIPASMRSPVTSTAHSSLTNLDVWSPNSVSIDTLLRHPVNNNNINTHSTSGINNGFAHVNARNTYTSDRCVRKSLSEDSNSGDCENGWNYYGAHPGYRSGAPDYADLSRSHSLRRTMSEDSRSEEHPHLNGNSLGSTPHQKTSIPRASSDGDLLETEQESEESSYFTVHSSRESRKDTIHRRFSEITRGSSDSGDSRVDTGYHHNPATARESRKDTMHRKYSDNTPFRTTSLQTSASFSDFGIYKRYYSDESDYCYDSSYSSSGYSSSGSGSVSARNGSGSTGSLQRSGTVIADRAIMGRALSAERTFQVSPMERTRLPSRKKTSQTLQTVAENMVQGVKPTKSILKNGNNNRMSFAGNGGPMPRSASSSRRSSLTSYGGGNLSSDNLDSLEEIEVSSTTISDHAPLPATPATYTRGRQGKKQDPLTRGASSRIKTRRNSHPHFKHRSKSLSDLTGDSNARSQQTSGRYSDDEDGDDFGFLSHPVHAATVSVSAVSSKASSSSSSSSSSTPSTSSSQRLLPRRWRNKGKNSSSSSSGSSQQAMWNPEVSESVSVSCVGVFSVCHEMC